MIKKASHGEGNEDQSSFRLLKKQMKEKFLKKKSGISPLLSPWQSKNCKAKKEAKSKSPKMVD